MDTEDSVKVKSFCLYNHKVKVSYVKKIRGGLLGDCEPSTMKLKAVTHHKNEKLSDSAVEHNRWHEQVHLMLYFIGRLDLYEDEAFVDSLAGMLAQYEASKE